MPQGNRLRKVNQTLNKSILDHSMASVGNISIMDIMSGYKGGNTSEWGGKKTKKGPTLLGAPKDLNKSYFSGYNDLSDSGDILKVEAFSDSDSNDCQIVTDGPQEHHGSHPWCGLRLPRGVRRCRISAASEWRSTRRICMPRTSNSTAAFAPTASNTLASRACWRRWRRRWWRFGEDSGHKCPC